MYQCEQCGAAFDRSPRARQGSNRFCSKTCFYTSRTERPTSAICKVCGIVFVQKAAPSHLATRGEGQYCSLSCARRAPRAPRQKDPLQ